MDLTNLLTGSLGNYLSFLLGMFFAEETLVLTSFLVNQKLTAYYNILLAFAGVLFCNISLYFVGRFNLIKPLRKSKKLVGFSKKIEKAVNKLTKNKIERAIVYSKFIVASRFLVVMLIGYRKVKFTKFLKHMFLAELMWATVAVSIGLFAGESFSLLTQIFKSLTYAGTSFAVLAGIMIFIKKKIKTSKV